MDMGAARKPNVTHSGSPLPRSGWRVDAGPCHHPV